LFASPGTRLGPSVEQQSEIWRPFRNIAHCLFRCVGDTSPHLGIVDHDLHFRGESSSRFGRHAFHNIASDFVLCDTARSEFEFRFG
jgi:hypothetical protein